MRLSIILPVRNEEEIIEKTIKNILVYLKNNAFKYEIIVVLNGCIDSTEKKIKAIQDKNRSKINILKSQPGYGYALKKGLKAAKGKYITIFNVDFYDLRLLDLIKIDLYGKDLVIGSKMAYWSTDKRPLIRRAVSFIFNLYLRFFYGFKGSDTHGLKIMKKDVVDEVLKKCKTSDGIFDTEFVIRSQRMGFKIIDVPVDICEVRKARFTNRFLSTPIDMYNLYKALQ